MKYQDITVNGENYIFSQDVLKKGNQLISSFRYLNEVLRQNLIELVNKSFMDNNQLANIENNIKKSLENFDKYYIIYEKKLFIELLSVEQKGKKHIIDIINIEKELTNYENKYMKGKNIYMIN